MSKKNFDAFVSAAGKKKKPTPEEIEELSQLLHAPAAGAVPETNPIYKEQKPAHAEKADTPKPEKQVFKLAPEKTAAPAPPKTAVKKSVPAAKTAAPKSEIRNPKSEVARRIVGKEKVRVTIDLEKGLYQRLKMRVVVEETDLSTYVRGLLEQALV